MILHPISAFTKMFPKHPSETEGKMTWADVKAIYPPPSAHESPNRDDLTVRTRATMKNHRHNHNPARGHSVGKMTPAEWKHARRKRS